MGSSLSGLSLPIIVMWGEQRKESPLGTAPERNSGSTAFHRGERTRGS